MSAVVSLKALAIDNAFVLGVGLTSSHTPSLSESGHDTSTNGSIGACVAVKYHNLSTKVKVSEDTCYHK